MAEPKIEGTEQVPDKPEAPEPEATAEAPAEEPKKAAPKKAAAKRGKSKKDEDGPQEDPNAPRLTGNIGPGWEAMAEPRTY